MTCTIDSSCSYVPHLIGLNASDVVVVMVSRLEKYARLKPFYLDADGRAVYQITETRVAYLKDEHYVEDASLMVRAFIMTEK